VVAVALTYLAWAPLGVEPVQRFLEALERHPPGVEHRLIVAFKGWDDPPRETLRGVAHDELVTGDGEYDLATYRQAADQCAEPVLAFVNSAATPLVDGWLATLVAPLADPSVGMVSATASFESALSAAPRPLKPLRLATGYVAFPNPHLRTNAFALRRTELERLKWGAPRTKGGALRLESGRHGLTRQIQALGLRPVVAGRDAVYDIPDWPASATFRSGDQEQLLVADNRTRQYAEASPEERARLAKMAWGP
jgi:hypothetical protein